MRKSRFSEEQIVAIMRESEAPGSTVSQVAKRHSIDEWTRECLVIEVGSSLDAQRVIGATRRPLPLDAEG